MSTEPATPFDRRRALGRLLPLFFVSGATGLVYQTIWARQLHLLVGTSTIAIATVLAAFMLGLAVGGGVAAGAADRVARPLVVYGLLEIGIGLFALAFPGLLDRVSAAYVALDTTTPTATLVLAQLGLAGALLVVPAGAMGATLPLLARFAVDADDEAGDRVGRLYAANTAGAVAGTALAGFVLLPGVGLAVTTWIAAAANVGLGLAALGLAHGAPSEGKAPAAAASGAVAMAATVAALAGFASLVLEVAWFRVLGLMLGASAYAFTTMLLAFLVGIALGGGVGGRWADRALAAEGLGGVLRRLAVVEVGVGAAALVLAHAWGELPFAYVTLFDLVDGQAHATAVWAIGLLLSALVMLPPAVLMGVAFPVAVRAAIGRAGPAGRGVGRVQAANTLGGVVGAALAGFVLLPWLEVRGTVALAAGVNVVAGLLAWAASGDAVTGLRSRSGALLGVGLVSAAVAGVVAPPTWDPLMMTAGMYHYVTSFSDHSRDGIRRFAAEDYELLYYREGPTSVVTVARTLTSGNTWLANNGKIDASTTMDMPTQILVSLLPMAYVEAPRDVLVVGLASGVTAGAVTMVDGLRRLDVVEIEPAIEDAARLFDAWNHGLLRDPRTRLVVADGRNHLLRTPPATYDVVVSEPSNPWLTGVSNLFTREFFELGRPKVRPGGAWSQWVQLYGMDEDDVRSLLGTVADVWPGLLVFTAVDDADLVLVAADRPLAPSLQAAERLFADPEIADELIAVGLESPYHVLAAWVLDRDAVLALAGEVVRNTDDNARIEYAAPLHLHADTQAGNAALLERGWRLPVEALPADADAFAALAGAYLDTAHPERAIDALVHAAWLTDEGDPRRAALVDRAFGLFVEGQGTPEPDAAAVRALQRRFLAERLEPARPR